MRLRLVAYLLLLLLATSLVGAVVYGRLHRFRRIRIAFEEEPPRKIGQGEVYPLQVSWKNQDRKRSYKGSFVFVTKARKIKADHITFTFEHSNITPQESKNTLRFVLPEQSFPAGASGTISVEIVYNRAGIVLWKIGVARFS
jgi:hypothetical protein